MDLPLHPQGAGPEIQVTPLEGQDLAPAQASGQLQQKQLVAAVLLGLDQQPLDLLRSQHLHFSGLGRREFTAVRRVAEDQLFLHCLVQCGVEGGVDAPDGLVGETLSIELRAQQSAVLLEMGIELLDVPGGQLVQLDTAQRRG